VRGTLVALLFAALPAAAADPGVVVLRGGRVVTVSGPVLEKGIVVLSAGKIAAIGPDVPLPPGATVVDVSGQTVYPGLIDALTTVGLTEISSVRASMDVTEVRDFNPQVKALVALNPHTAYIPVARANGITAVQAAPQGKAISGQAAVLRLSGTTPDALTVKAASSMQMTYPGGAASDDDEEAADKSDDEPETYTVADRLEKKQENQKKALEKIANLLDEARAYGAAVDAAAAGTAVTPKPDPVLEGLVAVVRGTLPLEIRADNEADIRGAVAFAEARGLKLTIAGGLEAWRCADLLKQKDVAVLVKVLRLPRRRSDPYDAAYANAAVLQKAGVRFAIVTDDDAFCRNLPFEAAMARAYGLAPEAALRAITLAPAEILGVADRMGSLDVGKDANVIVATGDIMDGRSRVTRVFIDGAEQSLETRHTRLYDAFKDRP
jgi:imidazolonepropionase-like amidohydrolase